MAVEQDWAAYSNQATLADTDTILARTSGGAGVEIPGSAIAKTDGFEMSGKMVAVVSAAGPSGYAGLNLPHGAAPTTNLADGDIWTTASGLFVRINGVTVGPLSASTVAPAAGFSGLAISTVGVSNYTSVVTANLLALNSAAGTSFVARNVNVSPNISASGANGLDTGTLAVSTWYYVYVIYNPSTSTVAGLFSASATSPNLPSGYTFFSRVGAVRTDASGSKYLLQTRQYGRWVQYVVLTGSNVAGMPQMAGGSSAVGNAAVSPSIAVSVSSFVPPTAYQVKFSLYSDGGASDQAIVAPNNNYASYNSTANPPPVCYTTTGNPQYGTFQATLILESSSIYWAHSGGFYLYCNGWEDNL